MRISPHDIACFLYCPILFSKGMRPWKTLSVIEASLKKSFIEAERRVALKDSIVTARKLNTAWDSIWWPKAAELGLTSEQGNKVAIRAAIKLSDYCKYNITDWLYPTMGVEIDSQVKIGQCTLTARADLIKADLDSNRKTTILISFDNRDLTAREAVLDPIIRTTAYAFYRDRGEIITHIHVNLRDGLEKLHVTTSIFGKSDMAQIQKVLYYVERGIYSKVQYANTALCEKCQACAGLEN